MHNLIVLWSKDIIYKFNNIFMNSLPFYYPLFLRFSICCLALLRCLPYLKEPKLTKDTIQTDWMIWGLALMSWLLMTSTLELHSRWSTLMCRNHLQFRFFRKKVYLSASFHPWVGYCLCKTNSCTQLCQLSISSLRRLSAYQSKRIDHISLLGAKWQTWEMQFKKNLTRLSTE